MIQGEPVGTLFISLPVEDKAKFDAAITYLNTHADATEVLGYVSGDVDLLWRSGRPSS